MFTVPVRQTEIRISIGTLVFVIALFIILTSSKNNILEINSTQTNIPSKILSENALFMLNGFWEFFPGDYIPENFDETGEMFMVPGSWESAFYDVPEYKMGYGSYRLKLKLPLPGVYGIKVNNIANSCAIYINGKLEYSRGVPGTSATLSQPSYTGGRFLFTAEERDIEIVIHVSNFNDDLGGVIEPIILGNSDAIDQYNQTAMALQMIMLGAMLLIFLYNQAMYFITDKQKAWLILSFLALSVSARILASGEIFLISFLPNLNWYIFTRSKDFIFCLIGILLVDFYYIRFNWIASKRIFSIVTIFSVSVALLIITLPLRLLEPIISIYKVVGITFMFLLVLALIKGIRIKKSGSIMALSVLLLFMISLVLEGMYWGNVIKSTYALLVVPIAEIAFNFIQGLWILYEDKNKLYIQNLQNEQENSKLKSKEDDLKKENLDLFRKVTIDPQTDLLNHRNLELKFASGEGASADDETTIISIDIVNLKQFKDDLGRKSVDSIVKWFAGTLIRSARRRDSIYRISDNEFAIILKESESGISKFISKKLESSILKVQLKDLLIHQIDIQPSYLEQKKLICRIGIAIKPRGIQLDLEELHMRSEYAMRSVDLDSNSSFLFWKE